jgi:preprotein translocase subunit Sec61beta
MTLSKLYKYTTIYPALIAIIGSAILSVYDNKDYKSEWLSPDAVVLMCVIASVIYSAIVCLFSLGLFLNGVKKVRDHYLWSLLSWFLLPYGFMAIAVIKTVSDPYASASNVGYLYLVTLNMPFMVSLTWTFILFRGKLKQTVTGNDI